MIYKKKLQSLNVFFLLPQDVLSCIGGVQVLFPILETAAYGTSVSGGETHGTQLVDVGLPSPAVEKTVDNEEDWEVLPSSSYAGKCQYSVLRVPLQKFQLEDTEVRVENREVSTKVEFVLGKVLNNIFNHKYSIKPQTSKFFFLLTQIEGNVLKSLLLFA